MTPAKGFNNKGCFQCPEATEVEGSGSDSSGGSGGSGAAECDSCDDTKFGCCADELRAAQGPNGEGCEPLDGNLPIPELSGIPAIDFPLLLSTGGSAETTADASGKDFDCKDAEFGCCLDEKTAGN